MIHSLRKKHRNVWLLIALFVPVIIGLAIAQTPSAAKDDWLHSEGSDVTPIVKEYALENLKINFRGSSEEPEVLEIVILTPLKVASAELSIIKKGGEIKKLGQLGSSGVYHFKIEGKISDWKSIHLFDYIKQQEINKIEL